MTNNIINKIQHGLLYLIVAATPFIFIPILTDAFEMGKQTVLLAGIIIVMLLTLIELINTRQLVSAKPVVNGYFKYLIVIALVFLLSSLINTPNKLLSITSIGGPLTWVILIIFYIYILQANKKSLVYSLMAGASILSVISVIFTFLPLTYPVNIPLTSTSIAKYFSPAGNLTTQILFLGALIPLVISLIYQQIKTNRVIKLIPLVIGLIIIILGLTASIFGLSNQPKGTLLPQSASWSIALETMKNGRQAILGFGPGQYVNAFTTSKPISFNLTPVWNTRFSNASNWYFQVLTETGLAGVIIIFILLWVIISKTGRLWKDPSVDPIIHGASLSLLILFIGLAVLPGSLINLLLLIILLAITERTETVSKDLSQLGGFIYPLAIFPLVLWGGLLYLGYRQVFANHYYYQSIIAANANDGLTTYNNQVKTIQIDPSSPVYRWAYAQTNLALANAIASQATTDNPLSDEQRNNISQLIQQAINEAKSTVALDPRSAAAWENLAVTYRSLINIAQDADQWSIDSYQQAITLDPLNPRLRLDFGSLYYSQKKYDLAANLFSQAVSLKSDYANAHYNLANALKELKQYQLAANSYQNTLSLVEANSQDFTQVNSELDEIKKFLPSPTPSPSETDKTTETLTKPVVAPQGINPPIEVPQGEPPVETVTDQPNPQVEP